MRARMARAIHKEVSDLIKVGTFELMPLPNDRQAIGSKFVLKVKYRADGMLDKDKARLVALGFLERIGVDFFSTFAPMASLTSVRTVIAIAVHHGSRFIMRTFHRRSCDRIWTRKYYCVYRKALTLSASMIRIARPTTNLFSACGNPYMD